jgi:hypothetical protein
MVPGLLVISLMAAALVAGLIGGSPRASAAPFGGVEFPQGAASFADAVVDYSPIPGANPLLADVIIPSKALGPPDHVAGGPAKYVSLGNGGSITLRFINNALTGSGSTAKDLWVFEIGPLVEDTDVAISRDGVTWIEVGKVFGSTSGIDIDPFVDDPATKYSFVRLTDVAAENFTDGTTAGADIDAVGAISTVIRPADLTPPTVTVPANITAEATGPGGAAVPFVASASDLVDGAMTPVCSPASGAQFPLGETAVTCSATDDAGNTGSAGFTVTVVDTTAPAVTVSDDLTVEATSAAGAVVQFDAATGSDLVDGAVTPDCDAVSGSVFPLGVTTVTCSVSDTAGNTGSDSFQIAVVDTTAPAVAVPAGITVEVIGGGGVAVEFVASADDLVDGPLPVTCSAVSGATFALGATTVTCAAIDNAGNLGSASFVVTVVEKVYGVNVLFDQSKAVKSGAVKPIKVQLWDEAGTNLSSPNLVLHAVGLQYIDGTPSAQVEDAGNANPDFDFRYSDGVYVFNLDTDGLSSGTWHLKFIVNGGANVYSVAFDVK